MSKETVKEKGNRPAFPSETNNNFYLGLTKREYFAVLAMQGMCAGRNMCSVKDAVELADLLLTELNKEQ